MVFIDSLLLYTVFLFFLAIGILKFSLILYMYLKR